MEGTPLKLLWKRFHSFALSAWQPAGKYLLCLSRAERDYRRWRLPLSLCLEADDKGALQKGFALQQCFITQWLNPRCCQLFEFQSPLYSALLRVSSSPPFFYLLRLNFLLLFFSCRQLICKLGRNSFSQRIKALFRKRSTPSPPFFLPILFLTSFTSYLHVFVSQRGN